MTARLERRARQALDDEYRRQTQTRGESMLDITVDRRALVDALNLIVPVTDKSSAKPILSNFVLTAEPGARVSGFVTDYELALDLPITAEIASPGKVCINAGKLADLCREMKAPAVHFVEREAMWIDVECGGSRLRMPGVEVGLYPDAEFGDDDPHRLELAGSDLHAVIKQVLYASQTSEARKNLMG